VYALRGDGFQAERWLDAAARAETTTGPAPDRSEGVHPWVAVGKAMLCRHGPVRMREDAELAIAELGPLSPLRAPAVWLLANALLLQGDPEGERRLAEAAEAAEQGSAPFAQTIAAAQLALLTLDRGDLSAAEAFLACAKSADMVDRFRADALRAPLHAAEARIAAATGDLVRARRALSRLQRLQPCLSRAIPFTAVQTFLETARVHLALDDAAEAAVALGAAREILSVRPELGILVREVATLRAQMLGGAQPLTGWESSLTPAELRLLPLLATHQSFPEIGERLFFTRNTVKTHAISIYRKLGVSSRSDAVVRAVELGLLQAPLVRAARVI
jgi:LuxR family maltose regulon positive regulatory protein